VEGRERGGRHGRGFLEREVGWHGRELVLCSARILGAGAAALAEHLIARLESLHTAAHRFDTPGQVQSRNSVLRPEQPGSHAHGERRASHAEGIACVKARRVNPDQRLTVTDDRLLDVPEPQDIG
jgi:hypothetical protein